MFLELKRLFFRRKNEVFGLDVGTGYVKVVKLRQDESGYKIIGVARREIVKVGQDEGRRKSAGIAKTIRRCVKSAQVGTRYAVCSVSGPDVAVRRFNFPPLHTEEINNAMLFEADQVCPFDTAQSIVDYQLVPEMGSHLAAWGASGESDKICGVFVAAKAEAIEKKSYVAKSASLSCVLMDVDSLALLNCFLGCEQLQPDQTVAIMDIGSSFTNLAILRAGALPFVRDLSYAGDKIISAVAADSELSRGDVRDLLFNRQEKTDVVDELSTRLEKACGKLVSDISETLRYYVAQEGMPVEKIFVCGGFAQAGGFVDLLAKHLPPQVVLWNPFDKIQCECGRRGVKLLKENGPAFALAAGLAMRTI